MLISQRVLALAILGLVGLTQTPASANVLKVAPTGAPYTQIQAAVNAAGNDDVILISPGVYSPVTIDGKSLTLCRNGTAQITIAGTTVVKNLAATQRVTLSQLAGFPPPTNQLVGDAGVALVIANNAGNVRVEGCAFFGAIGWGDNGNGTGLGCCSMPPDSIGRTGAIVRDNSAGVSFAACTLEGGRSASGNSATFACLCGNSLPAGDGLFVQATLVSIYDTLCTGGRGGHNGTQGGIGGTGCRTMTGALQTGVFASGTRFSGGKGGDAWDLPQGTVGGAGGHGMVLAPSTHAHVLDSMFFAGAGGLSAYGTLPPGASGMQTSGGGSLFNDPESRLVLTTNYVARAGGVVSVRVQGTPGQVIYLRVSPAPTFMILPSWRGTLLSLRTLGSDDTPIGRIPANGILQRRYVAPQLPAGTTSTTAFVQAYRVDPVHGPKLSAGTSVTLLR